MKRFLFIILMFACAAGQAQQQSFIAASLTITNAPTNGMTFAINGYTWTWTNSVTAANNQVQTTNNQVNTATNLWVALIGYPAGMPKITVQMTKTNTLLFMTYPATSPALVITTNGLTGAPSWATWVYVTNPLGTNIVLTYPTNGLSIVQQSNSATGVFEYLNSPYNPPAVNSALPQWSNFVNAADMAALSNYVGLIATNATNFTMAVSNELYLISSNWGWIETNYSSNLVYSLTNTSSGTVFLALTWCSNQFGALANNVNYHDLGDLTGNTNSILLTNEGGIYRMWAQANSGEIGAEWDFYESDGSAKWMQRAAGSTYLYDNGGTTARIEIDATTSSGGPTFIRGASGNTDIEVMPYSDSIQTYRPITFQTATSSPAVVVGTISNFPPINIPSDTTYNSIAFDGNLLTNAGDTIIRTVGLKFTTAGTYSVTVEFQGNNVIQTGSLTLAGAGYLSLRCEITLGTSGAYYWNSSGTGQGLSVNSFCSVGTGTLLTGSGNPTNSVVDIVAQNAPDDTWIYVDNIQLAPSSIWRTLP